MDNNIVKGFVKKYLESIDPELRLVGPETGALTEGMKYSTDDREVHDLTAFIENILRKGITGKDLETACTEFLNTHDFTAPTNDEMNKMAAQMGEERMEISNGGNPEDTKTAEVGKSDGNVASESDNRRRMMDARRNSGAVNESSNDGKLINTIGDIKSLIETEGLPDDLPVKVVLKNGREVGGIIVVIGADVDGDGKNTMFLYP